MLMSTHMYHIKKAKNRKIAIILSQIQRDYKVNTDHLFGIIHQQINRALRVQFDVQKLTDIGAEHYEECLKMIDEYFFTIWTSGMVMQNCLSIPIAWRVVNPSLEAVSHNR